jgi:hypothetical protein
VKFEVWERLYACGSTQREGTTPPPGRPPEHPYTSRKTAHPYCTFVHYNEHLYTASGSARLATVDSEHLYSIARGQGSTILYICPLAAPWAYS